MDFVSLAHRMADLRMGKTGAPEMAPAKKDG
jgi:hypothetical protein